MLEMINETKSLKLWSEKHQNLIDKLKRGTLTDEEHETLEEISTTIDNFTNEKVKKEPISEEAIKHYPYGHLGATNCALPLGVNVDTWKDVTCEDCKTVNKGENYWSEDFKKMITQRIKQNYRLMR